MRCKWIVSPFTFHPYTKCTAERSPLLVVHVYMYTAGVHTPREDRTMRYWRPSCLGQREFVHSDHGELIVREITNLFTCRLWCETTLYILTTGKMADGLWEDRDVRFDISLQSVILLITSLSFRIWFVLWCNLYFEQVLIRLEFSSLHGSECVWRVCGILKSRHTKLITITQHARLPECKVSLVILW